MTNLHYLGEALCLLCRLRQQHLLDCWPFNCLKVGTANTWQVCTVCVRHHVYWSPATTFKHEALHMTLHRCPLACRLTLSRVIATPHAVCPSALSVSKAAMPTQLSTAMRGSLPSSPEMLRMTTSPAGKSGIASAVTMSPSPCQKFATSSLLTWRLQA